MTAIGGKRNIYIIGEENTIVEQGKSKPYNGKIPEIKKKKTLQINYHSVAQENLMV